MGYKHYPERASWMRPYSRLIPQVALATAGALSQSYCLPCPLLHRTSTLFFLCVSTSLEHVSDLKQNGGLGQRTSSTNHRLLEASVPRDEEAWDLFVHALEVPKVPKVLGICIVSSRVSKIGLAIVVWASIPFRTVWECLCVPISTGSIVP